MNFGTYTGEILRAEGFNEFVIDSLSGGRIDKSYLARVDLVLLAEAVSDSSCWRMISEYVRNGGNLIAVQSVHGPGELFGIVEIAGNIDGGYITIDTFDAGR